MIVDETHATPSLPLPHSPPCPSLETYAFPEYLRESRQGFEPSLILGCTTCSVIRRILSLDMLGYLFI